MPPTAKGSRCLLVVDVQYDFMPGGALAVPGGDEVVPVINALVPRFENVVLTQDWHPQGHASFASAHAGKKPFETTRLAYGEQVLWPDHCVQGTPGAAIHAGLQASKAQLVIRKGYHDGIDSYSGFMEADRRTATGLAGYLKERGIREVFVCGLATDFCVAWTALDARKAAFEAYVIEDACRGIDLMGSLGRAWTDMKKAGVHRIQSADIAA
jgi:nicotinamidase/pyrazinamidase